MDYHHTCADAGCPHIGQRTDKFCRCHKTPEQMMQAQIAKLTTPRPISEYHEDMGAVLWWKFPIVEAPYVGSPNDLGQSASVTIAIDHGINGLHLHETAGLNPPLYVGGWPGYHTHFTPLPTPETP